jgi:DNA-3-methyladenine glycosylase II
MSRIEFTLAPVPPFSLKYTGWALKRLSRDTLHRFEDGILSRAVMLGDKPIVLSVEQSGTVEKPKLLVTASGARLGTAAEPVVTRLTEKLLGTNVDLQGFYRVAAKSGKLAKLAERFRGMKPPRFPSVFEAFVIAVANQQLSMLVGQTIMEKLIEAYGAPVPGTNMRAFPTPQTLAQLQPDQLMPIAFSRNKANYVIDLARKIVDGEIQFDSLEQLSDDDLMETLRSIRGVGRWTAHYMMLRGYGRLSAFPIDDVGARARLRDYLGLDKSTDVSVLERYVGRWNPYSGLLYFHLRLFNLAEKGELI